MQTCGVLRGGVRSSKPRAVDVPAKRRFDSVKLDAVPTGIFERDSRALILVPTVRQLD